MKNAMIAILVMSLSTVAVASTNSVSKKSSTVKATKALKKAGGPKLNKAEYGTSHSFNGTSIKGKVQEGNMRRIVVENDKSLDDLLGIRKNFDDREREETERNLSW